MEAIERWKEIQRLQSSQEHKCSKVEEHRISHVETSSRDKESNFPEGRAYDMLGTRQKLAVKQLSPDKKQMSNGKNLELLLKPFSSHRETVNLYISNQAEKSPSEA